MGILSPYRLMEPTKARAQQDIFNAMLKHDGNRARAAKELKVELRTFYRYISKYEMHQILQRCGWHQHGGPPAGLKTSELDLVKSLVIAYILRHQGKVDLGKMTREIYSEDTATSRTKLFASMGELRRMGRLEFDELSNLWTVREA